MADDGHSGGEEPSTELEMAQRVRQLRTTEDELRKTKDELGKREKELERKGEELRRLAEEYVKREDRLQERERSIEGREEGLLRSTHTAAAAALEARTRTVEAAEKKNTADARNLKNYAEQLMKKEQEYNIRVKNFNEEAESELRGRVESLSRREQEATRRDQEVAARAQENARREEELEKREKDSSERFQEAARREDQVRFRLQELEGREKDIHKLELDAVRRQEEVKEEEASGAAGQELARQEQELADRRKELEQLEGRLRSRESGLQEAPPASVAVPGELARKEEELERKAEELAAREASLNARSSAAAAAPGEGARLEELGAELEAKREEMRVRNKELKIRQEELERRDVELKEGAERLRSREEQLASAQARMQAAPAAPAAPPQLGEEERIRLDAGLQRRDDELRARDEQFQLMAQQAMGTLHQREGELADREEKLRMEADRLGALAGELKSRDEDSKEREDALQKGLRSVSDREELIREIDDRTRILEEKERADEQFHQELRALDSILQKRTSEQEAQDRALREREDALTNDEDSLDKEKAEHLRLKHDIERGSESLRLRSLEIENGANSLAERESVLKAEEQRMDQLADEMRKKKEEIDVLGKDLRYKEIHLATLEEEIKDCPYCSAKDGFVTTMRAIAEAKGLGADTSDAERLFKQARSALDSSSYEGAVQYARKAMILAREAKQKYLVYGVSYILSGAERAVRSAAQTGVDVSEAEGYLKSARESHDRKDYEAAEMMARRAERVAILAEDKLRELSDKLDRTSKRLEEIRSYGVDLSEAETAVEAARALMKERKQAESRARLEGIEETALLSFRREATRLLDDARDSINTGRAGGFDLGDAEMFFAKAEERLAEGDYGKSIQCAREASRLSVEAKAAGPAQEGTPAESGPRRIRSRPRILSVTARPPAADGTPAPITIITPAASAPALSVQEPDAATAPVAPFGGGPDTAAPGMAGGNAAQAQDAAGPAPSTVPNPVQAPWGASQQAMSAPRVIPPSQAAEAPPREYECPSCQNRFIIDDPRRPLTAKCPRCQTLMRLA